MNKILIVLVLAALAFAGWYFLSPSEESRVKETFAKMSAALDKDGNEPNLESIGKARRAVALVEPGCTVEAFGKTFRWSNRAARSRHSARRSLSPLPFRTSRSRWSHSARWRRTYTCRSRTSP